MKKSYLIYAFSILLGTALMNHLASNSGGAPSGRTGSPIDVGTCNASGCHNSFGLNTGDGSISIITNIPASGYMPGSTYNININVSQQSTSRFGFQASTYSTSANANVGAPVIINSNETRINPGMGNYVTHTSGGNSGTDTKDWSFDWTAPNPGVGEVTVFAAGIGADGGGSPANDQVYSTSEVFAQAPGVGIEPVRDIFEAKVFPTVADDFVFVEMKNLERGNLHIHIINLNGQQLYDLNQEITNESFDTRISVQNWASGVYLMTISQNGKTGFEKIVRK